MAYKLDPHNTSASLEDIARGYYDNARPLHIFGFNTAIGTSYETIFNDGGGIYPFPISGSVLAVVSDASDFCVVQITGLDVNFNEVVELVTLNGLTPVTTVNSFYRVNDARTVGALNTGNVTISHSGSTVAYLGAGLGVHQGALYTTAADETVYIGMISFTSGTVNPNKYLFGRAFTNHPVVGKHNFWESTWAVGNLPFILPMPFVIPPKTDFSLEVKSSSGENEVSVYINGYSITGD